jgi:hypothetical protein
VAVATTLLAAVKAHDERNEMACRTTLRRLLVESCSDEKLPLGAEGMGEKRAALL